MARTRRSSLPDPVPPPSATTSARKGRRGRPSAAHQDEDRVTDDTPPNLFVDDELGVIGHDLKNLAADKEEEDEEDEEEEEDDDDEDLRSRSLLRKGFTIPKVKKLPAKAVAAIGRRGRPKAPASAPVKAAAKAGPGKSGTKNTAKKTAAVASKPKAQSPSPAPASTKKRGRPRKDSTADASSEEPLSSRPKTTASSPKPSKKQTAKKSAAVSTPVKTAKAKALAKVAGKQESKSSPTPVVTPSKKKAAASASKKKGLIDKVKEKTKPGVDKPAKGKRKELDVSKEDDDAEPSAKQPKTKKRKIDDGIPKPPPLPKIEHPPRLAKKLAVQAQLGQERKSLRVPPANHLVGLLRYEHLPNVKAGAKAAAAPAITEAPVEVPTGEALAKVVHEEECCSSCSSRTAIKAVRTGSNDLLLTALRDYEHIANPLAPLSVDRTQTPLDIAILKNDIKQVILMLEYLADNTPFIGARHSRVALPSNNLQSESQTGQHSRYTYSHRVRNVTIGRGGKEGNAALAKTDTDSSFDHLGRNVSSWCKTAARYCGLETQLLEYLMLSPNASNFMHSAQYNDLPYFACESGNYKVAGLLVEELAKVATGSNNDRGYANYGNRGFNALGVHVLKTKPGEKIPAFRKVSVLKKGCIDITPLHMAAINPNTEVLKELLMSIDNNAHHVDGMGRLPVHFAAACETPDNIKYLIQCGASPKVADKTGIIPLHLAAKYGRTQNIPWLLQGDTFDGKYHDKKGNTALAIAAYWGHADTAKALLDWGASIEESTKPNKLTALIVAARQGHADVVKLLISRGANVNATDKLKRTALIHGAKNGCFDACLALLHGGADANLKDSSGNSAAHYASAYGYPNILRLLWDLGKADLNAANLWKITPLCVAVIKSHFLCIDYLLSTEGVHPDFTDEEGRSLLHYAAMNLSGNSVRMTKYLLEKKAPVNSLDADEETPLHHLCKNSTNDHAVALYKILIENGCDVNATSKQGTTPLIFALSSKNIPLVLELIKAGARPQTGKAVDGSNVLHTFFSSLIPSTKKALAEIEEVWEALVESPNLLQGRDTLSSLANEVNKAGYTPGLVLITKIKQRVASDLAIQDETQRVPVTSWISFFDKVIGKLKFDINAEVQREIPDEEEVVIPVKGTSALAESPEKQKNRVKGEGSDNEEEEEEEEEESEHEVEVDGGAEESKEEEEKKAEVDAKVQKDTERKQRERDSNQACLGYTSLHFLCESETLTDLVVHLLTVHKAKINATDYHNQTPLFVALKNKLASTVNALLERKPDVNIANSTLQTPLMLAAGTLRDMAVVDRLCKAGAKVDLTDKDKRTALMLSVLASKLDSNSGFRIERILLRHGANINAQDSVGRTCLHFAFTGTDDMALPKKKVPKRYYWDADTVVEKDPIDIVSDLSNVDNVQLNVVDIFDRSPLHYAAECGALISSLYLIQRGAQVNVADCHGNTPLSLGVMKGFTNFGVMLLNNGAEPVKDFFVMAEDVTVPQKTSEAKRVRLAKNSLFKCVLIEKYMGLAYIMMDSGVDVLTAVADALGTANYQMVLTLLNKTKEEHLHKTTEADKKGLIHILAAHSPQNADLGSSSSSQPRRFGTPSGPSVEEISRSFRDQFAVAIAEGLMDHSVDIQLQDKEGNTALHYAAKNLHYTLCEFLIKSGVDVNLPNTLGETPLVLAVRGPNMSPSRDDEKFRTLSALLSGGAKLVLSKTLAPASKPTGKKGGRGKKAPTAATASNATEGPSALFVPVIEACKKGDRVCLEYLLEEGADILEVQPKSLKSALMYAVQKNYKATVEVLLKQPKASELVRLTDAKGFTAIHYVVAPTPIASYENVEMLELLVKSGGDVKAADKGAKPPLYYASLQCSGKLKAELVKFGAKPVGSVEPAKGPEAVPLPPAVDLQEDSQKALQRMELAQRAKKKPLTEEEMLKEKVDPQCNSRHRYKVVKLEGVVYSATLNKTDVSMGYYGKNDFYVLQVLQEDCRQNLVILFTRWGRIGSDGMHQETPFATVEAAIHEFKKVFQSKTGNNWANRSPETFAFQSGKYNMVRELPPQEKVDALTPFPKNLASPNPEILISSTQKLMQMISDSKLLKETLKQTNYNLPFGAIHNHIIRQALEHLKQIAEVLEEKKAELATVDGKQKIVANADILRSCEDRITRLSNLYYTFIPQGSQDNLIVSLNTRSRLNDAIQILQSLSDVHAAGKVILGAHCQPAAISPYEYIYRAIGVGLRPLDSEDPMKSIIARYHKNTSSLALDLIDVFQVDRPEERENMVKHSDKKRMLLWHGSPLGNVIGILKDGLKIAPATANISGHAFGKGIYFSDAFEKSQNYLRFQNAGGKNARNYACMFLCEVAVGKMYEAKDSFAMEESCTGYDSTKALGKRYPHEDGTLYLQEGIEVPAGPLVSLDDNKWSLMPYNEYIVYDPSLVRIRYLLFFKAQGWEDVEEEEPNAEEEAVNSDAHSDSGGSDSEEDEDC